MRVMVQKVTQPEIRENLRWCQFRASRAKIQGCLHILPCRQGRNQCRLLKGNPYLLTRAGYLNRMALNQDTARGRFF